MLGFAHDWANREATLRSWDLFARYVIPEIKGCCADSAASADFVHEHQGELMATASAAVMAKIMQHDGAARGDGGHTSADRRPPSDDEVLNTKRDRNGGIHHFGI